MHCLGSDPPTCAVERNVELEEFATTRHLLQPGRVADSAPVQLYPARLSAKTGDPSLAGPRPAPVPDIRAPPGRAPLCSAGPSWTSAHLRTSALPRPRAPVPDIRARRTGRPCPEVPRSAASARRRHLLHSTHLACGDRGRRRPIYTKVPEGRASFANPRRIAAGTTLLVAGFASCGRLDTANR